MRNSTFGSALEAFKKQSFDEAFDYCNQMPGKETLRLLTLSDIKKQGKKIFGNPEFWKAFISKSTQQSEILKSPYADKILFEYWKNFPSSGEELFQYLSKWFPQKLIDSIRLNAVFRNKTKWSIIKATLKFHPDNYIHNHFLFCELLIKKEAELKNGYEQFQKELDSISVYELLVYLSLWYEFKRLSVFNVLTFDYDKPLEHFARAVNYCLNDVVSKRRSESIQAISEDELYETEKLIINNWVSDGASVEWFFNYMKAVMAYMKFERAIIHSYVFDLNCKPERRNNGFVFYPTDNNKHKKWIRNGEKLKYYFKLTEWVSSDEIGEAIKSGEEKVFGINEEEQRINIKYTEQGYQTKLISNYYGLGELDLEFLQDISNVWNGFAASAFIKLVNPITKKYHYGNNWLESILLSLQEQYENKEECYFPLWSGDRNSVLEIVESGLLRIEEFEGIVASKEGKDKIKNRAKRISSELIYELNGDNKQLNIFSTPFIKIHNTTFCFLSLLAEVNVPLWVVNHFLEKANNDERIKEIGIMEKSVMQLFSDKLSLPSVSSIKYKYKGSVIGESDVMVYCEGILLQIEMKRTRIGLDLIDSTCEYSNNLLGAAMQLYNMTEIIKSDFNWLKEKFPEMKEENFDQLKTEKLIVTNSFESDHELIDGNLKISLFELEELLFEIKPTQGKNTIEQLIAIIRKEDFWKEKVRSINEIDNREVPKDFYRMN